MTRAVGARCNWCGAVDYDVCPNGGFAAEVHSIDIEGPAGVPLTITVTADITDRADEDSRGVDIPHEACRIAVLLRLSGGQS